MGVQISNKPCRIFLTIFNMVWKGGVWGCDVTLFDCRVNLWILALPGNILSYTIMIFIYVFIYVMGVSHCKRTFYFHKGSLQYLSKYTIQVLKTSNGHKTWLVKQQYKLYNSTMLRHHEASWGSSKAPKRHNGFTSQPKMKAIYNLFDMTGAEFNPHPTGFKTFLGKQVWHFWWFDHRSI